jgi:hypothetical protein
MGSKTQGTYRRKVTKFATFARLAVLAEVCCAKIARIEKES